MSDVDYLLLPQEPEDEVRRLSLAAHVLVVLDEVELKRFGLRSSHHARKCSVCGCVFMASDSYDYGSGAKVRVTQLFDCSGFQRLLNTRNDP